MAIKGLDAFAKKMKELEKAIASLDGDITNVTFNPHDPQSIEIAIQKMETAIDERVGYHPGNDMIEEIVSQMKERYRQSIIDRATEIRNEGSEDS